jgi:fumarate reductase subunit D
MEYLEDHYRDKTMSQGEIINFCYRMKKLSEETYLFIQMQSLIRELVIQLYLILNFFSCRRRHHHHHHHHTNNKK